MGSFQLNKMYHERTLYAGSVNEANTSVDEFSYTFSEVRMTRRHLDAERLLAPESVIFLM